jgi:hypothetical protein
MRKDLAKCTTESPRAGIAYAKAYKLKFGGKVRVSHDPEFDYLEERGGFRSSAANRHFECKEFTDRLGALRGNLRKNLGRPWNKVYSEFCAMLDRRSLSGLHIWTHLMAEVASNTFMQDGKVYTISRRGKETEVKGFFVHPETGLLSHPQRRRDKRARPQPYRDSESAGQATLRVPGDAGWWYRQIDGLWFRCRVVGKSAQTGQELIQRKSANKNEIAWIHEELARPSA